MTRTVATVSAMLAFTSLIALSVLPAIAEDDAWAILETAKQKLRDQGPTSMQFVQTLTPAGFTGGDSEGGKLAIDLPGCLRWDYEQPYPRSFLICGSVGHHWNQGESVGRRFFVTADEPGLDLLLQARSELEARYRASVERGPGVLEVVLGPRGDSELVEARLGLDSKSTGLRELSYRDKEGNHNQFTFSEQGPLEDRTVFEVPIGVAWSQD